MFLGLFQNKYCYNYSFDMLDKLAKELTLSKIKCRIFVALCCVVSCPEKRKKNKLIHYYNLQLYI